MRRLAPLLATFLSLVVLQPCAAADKEKLRSVARLPRVTVLFGLGFNTWNGVSLTGDDVIARAEAVALEKSLKGDAGDADRLDELGVLYDRAGDSDKSKQVSARAVELYRKQLQARPDDPRLLARLGHALDGAGELDEAEKVLRRAVQLAPGEWLGWVNLGRRLDGKSFSGLWDGKAAKRDFMALVGDIVSRKVSPERLATALEQLEEARRCYDQAVALAPREALGYEQRALSRSVRGFLVGCQEVAAGKPVNPLILMLSPDAIPDLEQAVQLDPENYRLRGLLLWYYLLPAALTNGPDPNDRDHVLNTLPEKQRASARAQLAKLEAVAAGNSAPAAAGACEILGVQELIVHRDPARTGEWFHRAVKLAPTHEAAWDMLAGALAGTDPAALVAVSEERVQYQDTAKNRFLLAKAYEARNQLDKALEAIDAALQRDPKYFPARVGRVALLLRRNGDAATLQQAGKLLDELAADEASQPPLDHQSYAFTRAIYLGLCDKQADAQAILQRLVAERCAFDTLQTAFDALAATNPSP